MFKNSLCCLSLIGFAGCWGMGAGFSGAIPASAVPPSVLAQTQPTPEIEPLLGEWRFTEEGESIGLIFSTDNRVFFILPDSEGSAIAVQMKYETNLETQPQHLDIIASPEERMLTIFELTPEGQLSLDLDVQPGDPRPERLGENALLFERVSDATAPPEAMQVIDLTAAPPPSTAVQLITILLRAQQVYYLEQGQFAADVEELGLVAALETEEYVYEIQTEGDRTETVAIAAIPKDEGLSSYAGAVFALSDNGEPITVAGICQSDRPSLSPPIPLSDRAQPSKVQCPSGSSLLE